MKLRAFILTLSLFAVMWQTATASEKKHGLSAFGELKYPADFKHFDYVNPKAPKGGRISMIGPAGFTTFNSFNGYILLGIPAHGLGYAGNTSTVFDQLMVRAWDEPDAVYGLVAHSAEVADDKLSVIFYLRPEAKFSDGSLLTAEDVIFTYTTLKNEGHPGYSLPLQDVVKATAIDKYTVKYEFTGENIRDLPTIVATLPIFSKKYYTGRKFNEPTLDIPVGSGPYVLNHFVKGKFVNYKLRQDYWAKDLPVNMGRFNFDELRYKYYSDRNVEFEALKTGQVDFREEFTSKIWATQYNFTALKEGKVVKLVTPDKRPSGAQGFFMNSRKPHLQDPKVRRAIALAFDFEWTNKSLFYGLYKRTNSYFENSDLKANGLPSKEELALLEPFRSELPKEVFLSHPYIQPVTNGSGRDRKVLLEASKLLTEAGWKVKNGKRVNAKGDVLTVEFLTYDPGMTRIVIPYRQNLKILGIVPKIRQVDPTQYENRKKKFEYDVIAQRYVMRLLPGVELRNYFHSSTVSLPGSDNLGGINSKAIDALIDNVMQAKNRKELVTATRALDRVLRAGHYWIPHWYKASHTMAFWTKFSRPATKPAYHRGIIDIWWQTPASPNAK